MAEIAERWGGTVDKFIGDAVMVMFGAPDPMAPNEGALRAVGMATEMQRALSFRALSEGRYVVVARSEILPEIDPSLVAECMAAGSQTEGLRLLRQRIRGS